MDSSSSLKDFSFNRKLYYKKWILKEPVEEKDSDAILMGKLVETILLEPEKFDDKFHFSVCANIPTGLMKAFVDALYKHTIAATDEDGVITDSFENISKKAYVDSGFKYSYERVLKDFEGKDAEIYFNELKLVKSKGLTVVSPSAVAHAENIVSTLKNAYTTSDVLNNCLEGECFNQYPIEGYTVGGHKFKSLVDRIVFNPVKKTIQVYDLKCVWNVEDFYENYYLYRRAYIQGHLYYRAAKHLTLVDEKYFGWTVLPPKFIVCDSANYYTPLIYEMSEIDIEEAWQGFSYKDKYYKGVKDLISELKWAVSTDEWGISKENYENGGLVKLKKDEH